MAELTIEEQRREMAAFSQWAWRKEGEPIGRMLGQVAAREAWLARAAQAKDAAAGVAVPDAAAVLRELVEADAAYTNKGRINTRTEYDAIVDRYFDAWAAARAFASGVPVPEALDVLTELVACVDGDCSTREKLDYWDKREAAAWDRARALVGATHGVKGPDHG